MTLSPLYRRNPRGFICEILLPAFFVCLALVFSLVLPGLVEEPPLQVSPWLYPTRGGPNTIFYSKESNPGAPWAARYTRQLRSGPGWGARCGQGVGEVCQAAPAPPPRSPVDDSLQPDCSCVVGTQVCPVDSFSPAPAAVVVPGTKDILVDLSGRNTTQWLLKTRPDLSKQRYGGFEFGVRNPLAGLNLSLARDIVSRLDRATNLNQSRLGTFAQGLLWDTLVVNNLNSMEMFDNVRVWFNNKGWAASVAYMNGLNNLILRASMKEKVELDSFDFDSGWGWDEEAGEHNKYEMNLINHPLNYTDSQLDKELM